MSENNNKKPAQQKKVLISVVNGRFVVRDMETRDVAVFVNLKQVGEHLEKLLGEGETNVKQQN